MKVSKGSSRKYADDVFVGQIAYDYTGNRIEHVADYFPYGKILREFVESDNERFLTTQHERDRETGLDYRGARYYDSDIARFLSLDPLAKDFPSWSDYNYVMGNPVMLIDPTGMSPDPPEEYTGEANGNSYGANTSYMNAYFSLMMEAAGGDYKTMLNYWQSGKNGWLNQEDAQQYKFGVAMEQFSLLAKQNAALKNEFSGGAAQYIFDAGFNPFSSSGSSLRVDLGLAPADQQYNILNAVSWIRGNAFESSKFICATHVRKGLEAGGISTWGGPKNRPNSAGDYNDGFLQSRGFYEISSNNYQPQLGDITVWEQGAHSEHGHVQMYLGNGQWGSDYIGGFYPYRDRTVPYSIFRR